MSLRRLPVRPDLDQLHRQGKDLLRAIQAGDATATADSCTCNSPTRSRRDDAATVRTLVTRNAQHPDQ